jgi:hypothetical protein
MALRKYPRQDFLLSTKVGPELFYFVMDSLSHRISSAGTPDGILDLSIRSATVVRVAIQRYDAGE